MANPERTPNYQAKLEQVKENLTRYISEAKIGSPKLLAFSDNLHKNILWGELHYYSDAKNKVDERASKVRIAELEIALLSRQINTQ